MKLSYLWTWPLAVVALAIGFNILFNISPVYAEHDKAVSQAAAVNDNATKTTGTVLVNYDYIDQPRMGSRYGADVLYTSNDGKLKAAWIAMNVPLAPGSSVDILYSKDINNFALNAKYPKLPQEIPDESQRNTAIIFITIPVLYALGELLLLIIFRARGKTHPRLFKLAKTTAPNAAIIGGIGVAVKGLFSILFCLMALGSYTASSSRIESVRDQEQITLASLDEQCMTRPAGDCSNRYFGHYMVDDKPYTRSFQTKGEIVPAAITKSFDSNSPDSKVPLLYNQRDPRFSYALSSSEHLEKAYDVGDLILGALLVPLGIVVVVGSISQKRRENG